ncbi:YetF domain-containing protein [Oceanobacillus polygoni]|uniref:YetF domain-containing protein n=1 Tax=Oceanobacillus polygoni TaxID=1235259 RepID=UPI003B8A7E84
MDEGRIEKKALKYIQKDEKWLRAQLAEKGYKDLSKIYYAEWSCVDGFVVRGGKVITQIYSIARDSHMFLSVSITNETRQGALHLVPIPYIIEVYS